MLRHVFIEMHLFLAVLVHWTGDGQKDRLSLSAHLPALMISERNLKMTHGKGFMYNNVANSLSRVVHISQINLSFFRG